MSQYVEVNASRARNVNGRLAENVYIAPTTAPRAKDNGRPMVRVRPAHPLNRHEPVHSGATTMTAASTGRVNPAGAGPTGRRVVHFSLGKSDAPALQTCTNAWVPSFLKKKTPETAENAQPSDAEELKIEETQKKLMSILNKVSPENMHLLTKQIMALPIDSEQCLEKAIDLLFQKAISEPNFTPQYAHICTEMHKKDTKRTAGTKPKTTFKKLLTTCCQDRLNEMQAHDEALSKTLQELEKGDDQDLKEQLQSTYDQDEMSYRKRSVGNCRFMCELYKVEMLTRNILEISLKYLLKSPKEETIECACNILKHVGNTISHKASFNKISEYTSPKYHGKIPTRIRFMMQDIIELQENNWVPRISRPKQPNTTALPLYPKKPVPRVLLAPTTLSMQKKKEVPTNIPKVNVGQSNNLSLATKIELPTQPLTPVSVIDGMKSYATLVSPCAGQVVKINKSSQPSDEEILKKCLSIVENLRPDNMIAMGQSMLALPVNTEECLKGMVDIVFEKAMTVPESTAQYAHICSVMNDVGVRSEDQKNTNTTFRVLLIAMCQDTFESMYTRKSLVAKDRSKIESCKDKETRRQLLLKFDENELKYKNRSVANCRFMCELLKVNILTPPILEMCMEKLVETLKEISMKCLYVIVKHTDNEINHSNIFERLHECTTSNKQKLSSRVRSVIQETLDLKDSD